MNPQILALLQKYGFFAGMQPTVPQVQTMNPQGLLDSVHATPNNALGGMSIPSPTAAPLPADPAMGGESFGAKYGPMFRTAANILNQHSAPPPRPQAPLQSLFWHGQGGSY